MIRGYVSEALLRQPEGYSYDNNEPNTLAYRVML